jgi:hypothetical protein
LDSLRRFIILLVVQILEQAVDSFNRSYGISGVEQY